MTVVTSAVNDFERVIRGGGIVLFPSDTVYGLACDPGDMSAIERLYALKGRPADKAAAVMFFDLGTGLRAVRGHGPRTHAALHGLMPGRVTALLPNPSHLYPLACRSDPETLGLRIVSVPQLVAAKVAVLQTSANPSGGADARELSTVAPQIRAGADLVIDGGELPGVASTVVDLRRYEQEGAWSIVRQGALTEPAVAAALGEEWGFDPATYAETVRAEIPGYERFQETLAEAAASGWGGGRVLELGTGTGETAARLLARLEGAELVCLDESEAMLEHAARALSPWRVELVTRRLQDPLPDGDFELVVSSLAIHHLRDAEKRELFARIRTALAPGGRFLLGDVIVPEDPGAAVIPLTPGYDRPSPLADQLGWLAEAGMERVQVVWREDDLAIVTALRSS